MTTSMSIIIVVTQRVKTITTRKTCEPENFLKKRNVSHAFQITT